MANITQLLNNLETGDPKAAEELLPLVYSETGISPRIPLLSYQPAAIEAD